MIQKLAQKSYDEKIFKLAGKRLKQIKKITNDYADDEIEKSCWRNIMKKKAYRAD